VLAEVAARKDRHLLVKDATEVVEPSLANQRQRFAALGIRNVVVLIEKGSDRLLGAHVLGPEADEFTNVFTLAMQAGIRADALRQTKFVYPTQASNMKWML
jgi:pyruvate/2-oxoglutarate dehydrogenase complex dihydrolipoamide dehydrogenase (E3) component